MAMVFQSYALFPHLSVWDNIAFGLKIQKLGEDEIKRRTMEALKILNWAMKTASRKTFPAARNSVLLCAGRW